MSSNTPRTKLGPGYTSQRSRRRWAWVVTVLLLLLAIGAPLGYVLVQSNSIHKRRELSLQAGVLNATPSAPEVVHEWEPDAARGEEAWRNWMPGPNPYDSIDAKATAYPILRAAMLDGSERRAVLVWLRAQRPDGFDIEYAIISPGGRFSPARLVRSATQGFSGGKSQQPIRVWSAIFPDGDRSRFVFDFEIAGVRQSAEAKLTNSQLTFRNSSPSSGRSP